MIKGFFESRVERRKPKRFGGNPRQQKAKAAKLATIDYTVYQERGCDGCPLYTADLSHPKMKPTGECQPDIYILGEAPGEFEDKDGEQFVGRSGKLLRGTLKRAGLGSIRWDNCCRCRPPDNRTPERTEIERCRLRVIRSIERAQPKVLVAVGGKALFWATGETSILNWRGQFIPIRVGEHICWLYPILHPAFIVRAAGALKYSDTGGQDWNLVFKHDIGRLASRLAEGLDDPRPESLKRLDRGINYAIDSKGLVQLAAQLKAWQEEKAIIAFDIETTCLRPYQCLPHSKGILSIAFSDGDITWAVPISHRESTGLLFSEGAKEWKKLQVVLLSFLSSRCMKVAHNLSFELEWLLLSLLPTPPWKRTGWGDTMTQSYCLDERPGRHSLDDCCMRYFGFRLKSYGGVAKESKTSLADLPQKTLLRYNALDAKYTARLYYLQREELEREGLLDLYRNQVRRCMTLVKAQHKGLVVDFPLVAKFQQRIQRKIDKCLLEIQDSREAKLYERKVGSPLSPSSNAQLTVLFRDILDRPEGTRKKNKSGYSVDDVALGAMPIPIASVILRLRTLQKQKSTYIDPCMPDGGIVYADGRLHTNFNSMVTVTGRLSSDSPNVQNFPKREDAWIRAIVTTPKNHPSTGKSCEHVLVSVDYGQIEPRVIAMESKDKKLCRAIRERYDIHLDWAERIAKLDPKTYHNYGSDIKKLRQDVKSNWVLAGFYGANYDAISVRLGGLSRKCAGLFETFKEEFTGVWRWQEEQIQAYQRDGFVTGLTGRRRHAPLSVNQILNNPTQGIASDIVVAAMDRLSVRAEKEEEPAFQAVLNIHDDLSFYIPKARQEELTTEIVKEMLTPVFDWINVPLSVEVSAGPNWFELQQIGTYFSDDL